MAAYLIVELSGVADRGMAAAPVTSEANLEWRI
jgi:hypothetical protein